MKIQSIKLRDFRNLVEVKLLLGHQANVFVGQNGQGKTSFLEAIYLLSKGLSFRPSKWEHFIRHDATHANIEAVFEWRGSLQKATLEITQTKREFLLNDKKVSRKTLLERLPVILFSPESLQVIKEGPESRRALWDEIVSSLFPTEAEICTEYQKVLKTKARLLRDSRDGLIQRQQAAAVLESLQPAFLEKATELSVLRIRCIQALLPELRECLRKVMNRPDVDISVDYVISDNVVTEWNAAQIRELITARTLQLASQEWDSGLCLVGPHKHDISFVYCGNDSRFFCSQGQQRAILLSLKIAQALVQSRLNGTEAMLLLDDVLSELDSERRNFLVKFLSESSAQTIVTTTDVSFCKKLSSSTLLEFEVHEGVFQSVHTEYPTEQRLRRGFDQSP